MSKRVEWVLVIKQEIIVLPKAKPTVVGVPVTIRIKYSEPRLNEHSGNIVERVPRDWDKRIHNVNNIPRPNPPCCTYCHQIGHQINECPFIENNVKQGFAEHFQNLNPKPSKGKDHGDFEPKGLYHERSKIPNRLRKQMWRNNKVEMRAQNIVDVVPNFVTFAPSLFHHNNVGVTYERNFQF